MSSTNIESAEPGRPTRPASFYKNVIPRKLFGALCKNVILQGLGSLGEPRTIP